MNGNDFIKKVASVLRDNDIKKSVNVPKAVFTISDKNGNKKDFSVASPPGEVGYTIDDVKKIMQAVYAVIEDSVRHGESISFYGIGRFVMQKMMGKMCKAPGTGEWYEIPTRYVVKFKPGSLLRMAAQTYNSQLKDASMGSLPEPVYDRLDDIDDDMYEEDE